MKQLHIFKSGRHITMAGATLNFSEEMLKGCAAAYDPALHEAPVVIGHPKDNTPAWGWIKSLSTDGKHLRAEPAQIDPAFSELVENGRYKKISAAFYMPDAPNNPKPGTLYLRHVGFLGAQPPSIKGLDSVMFSEAEEGVVEFSDVSWAMTSTSRLFSGLRDFFIEKFGLDETEKVLPSWQIDNLNDAARTDTDVTAASFSEPSSSEHSPSSSQGENAVTKEEQLRIENENADLKRQLAAREAADSKKRRDDLHAANIAFAEKLVTEARLAPRATNVVVALLDAVDDGNTPVEFSEGTTTQPLGEAFKSLLSTGVPIVDFGEFASKDRAGGKDHPATTDDGFANFAESELDADRLAIHRQATALASKENISYDAALSRCI